MAKIEGFLKIVEKAMLKGLVLDGLFIINNHQCTIEGVESGAEVIYRLQGDVAMPNLGKLPISNLSYFSKVLEQFKGSEINIHRDTENMLTLEYEKRPWRFQLADEEKGIRHKLEDPALIDDVLKDEEFSFPLIKGTCSEGIEYLSILESQKVFFNIKKDGMTYITGGGEQESGFDFWLGVGKAQKKEMIFEVYKEKLLAVMRSLEFVDEEPEEEGKLKRRRIASKNPTLGFRLNVQETPVAIFKQHPNIWLLTKIE